MLPELALVKRLVHELTRICTDFDAAYRSTKDMPRWRDKDFHRPQGLADTAVVAVVSHLAVLAARQRSFSLLPAQPQEMYSTR